MLNTTIDIALPHVVCRARQGWEGASWCSLKKSVFINCFHMFEVSFCRNVNFYIISFIGIEFRPVEPREASGAR